MVVPTGVGASIGGYAGDALPAARLLAEVVDTLITHPNVLNGAMLSWPMQNVLYVEGSQLDAFAEGQLLLRPLRNGAQKIGLLLDRGIEEPLMSRQLQVAEAARATLGIDVHHCVVTSRPVGVMLRLSKSGASWGSVEDTDTLVQGARELISRGCTAVAVVVRFPEDEELFAEYRAGRGVDAIAGAEALISHVIGKSLQVPCAHAPAFSPTPCDASVSPKACAEELGYSFLPCVLSYLHRAPQLLPLPLLNEKGESEGGSGGGSGGRGCISAGDVDVVIAPYDALGGAAVLSLLGRGCTLIAVQENTTAMQGQGNQRPGRILVARSYAEAAGLVVALRAGILPCALTADVPRLPITRL
ncbi:hypothetical protein B484DRAFT_324040 [Ochromonadaceae sp. CCMP2298]|nr:hypothetical protein B484DRAFT_324040 [Ochromonadaceae sp. CCMP2298]